METASLQEIRIRVHSTLVYFKDLAITYDVQPHEARN